MYEELFMYKKVNFEKLEKYGFQKEGNTFCYSANILNNEFLLYVFISPNGSADTKLIELATEEEYILYKTTAVGTFVGDVRSAVKSVLLDISEQCYESSFFKANQSIKLIDYVRREYGDELEYLWEKFPDCAIWRRKDNQKWYAALLTVSRRKLGGESDEMVEIIDLKGKPETLIDLIDYKKFYPGWHMNKKHWYSIILDGSVSMNVIFQKINESYLLAL